MPITKEQFIERYRSYLANDQQLSQAVALGMLTEEGADTLRMERYSGGTVASAADILAVGWKMEQLEKVVADALFMQAQSTVQINEAMAALMLQTAEDGGNK